MLLTTEHQARFQEATETCLHFGQGQIYLFTADNLAPAGHYSQGLHSPQTGRTFRAASPGMFSFNSPLGACPKCRGFGRIIEIDYRLALPDHSLSIDEGAIKPWESEVYGESKQDFYLSPKKASPRTSPLPGLAPRNKLTSSRVSPVITVREKSIGRIIGTA